MLLFVIRPLVDWLVVLRLYSVCSLKCGCNGGCVREPEILNRLNGNGRFKEFVFYIIVLIITSKVHYRVIKSFVVEVS